MSNAFAKSVNYHIYLLVNSVFPDVATSHVTAFIQQVPSVRLIELKQIYLHYQNAPDLQERLYNYLVAFDLKDIFDNVFRNYGNAPV